MSLQAVKICCIQSVEEAHLAVAAGAQGIGLVSEMPSGPGVISENRIAEIATAMAGVVETFLLTSRRDASQIARQHSRTGTSTIQLCHRLSDAGYDLLRKELPGVRLVQVVHVMDQSAAVEAQNVAPLVDALLLDSGRPSGGVPTLGGTGRVHDWELSARIVQEVGENTPVYLAGGLHPGNVAEAIRLVRPYGVDVCSGLRPSGTLDQAKLELFMNAVGGEG